MTYLSESQLETYLFKRVSKLGGMALKFLSPGRAGVPDRIILMPGGRIYFVEMKSPDGSVNSIQEYVFEKFAELGFKVHILNSIESIEKFLSQFTSVGKK